MQSGGWMWKLLNIRSILFEMLVFSIFSYFGEKTLQSGGWTCKFLKIRQIFIKDSPANSTRVKSPTANSSRNQAPREKYGQIFFQKTYFCSNLQQKVRPSWNHLWWIKNKTSFSKTVNYHSTVADFYCIYRCLIFENIYKSENITLRFIRHLNMV